MTLCFDIAAGSVLGHRHRRKGQNNQDAFGYFQKDETAIAVVCDGCGSAPHSEVGAQLGARLVLETVHQQIQQSEIHLKDEQFWPTVQARLLIKLEAIATTFMAPIEVVINHYLLFTIVGVVITPDFTTIFGIGDGVFALNGEVVALGPFPDNAPPYLAYLLAEEPLKITPGFCDIKVYRQAPTAMVESVMIGSDGVVDLGAIASHPLPGKAESVGDLSQFWCDDRYFKNLDLVRRRLALINRESVKADWSQQQLMKSGGLLPDDTTLVVVRRSVS
ncbi:MAG: protein phosphatase 2C domain-containing protein [Leptolyngbyaceae cyanobacterium]